MILSSFTQNKSRMRTEQREMNSLNDRIQNLPEEVRESKTENKERWDSAEAASGSYRKKQADNSNSVHRLHTEEGIYHHRNSKEEDNNKSRRRRSSDD